VRAALAAHAPGAPAAFSDDRFVALRAIRDGW